MGHTPYCVNIWDYSPKGEKRRQKETYAWKTGWKICKVDDNYKPTDLKNSPKPKHKKNEGIDVPLYVICVFICIGWF